MKRILSVIAVACIAMTSSFAQNHPAQDSFKKHWYLQAQGGGSYVLGSDADFVDLLTPAVAFSLGYQHSPVFGVRFNGNGWRAKGSIGKPASIYSWKHFSGTVDMVLDLDNLFAHFRPDRFFNPYLFMGFGASFFEENNGVIPLKEQVGEKLDLAWTGNQFAPIGKIGIGIDMRICNWCSFNIESPVGFYPDRFNSKDGSTIDYQFSLVGGFTFRFGSRRKAQKTYVAPVEPVQEIIVINTCDPPAEEESCDLEKSCCQIETEPLVPVKENVCSGNKDGLAHQSPLPIMESEIYFSINEYDIGEDGLKQIQDLAAQMKECPCAVIHVTGHADKLTGYPHYNQTLSQKRADAVAHLLIDAGISEDRILIKALGDTSNPSTVPAENRVVVCIVE